APFARLPGARRRSEKCALAAAIGPHHKQASPMRYLEREVSDEHAALGSAQRQVLVGDALRIFRILDASGYGGFEQGLPETAEAGHRRCIGGDALKLDDDQGKRAQDL